MKIKKCIIPIAGRGTRFLPITKSVSKEMLPIVEKPTILYLVKECLESGIDEIIFVVGKHNYELVSSFFKENKELDDFLDDAKKILLKDVKEVMNKIKFHYVFQDENVRGTAGALYAAKDYIEDDEYFAVIFGDDLYDYEIPPIKQLIMEHEKHNSNVIGIGKVNKDQVSNYGILKYSNDNIVETIIEKPAIDDAPSRDAIHGRFILHGSFMNHVLTSTKHDNNEYFLPEVIFSLNEEIRSTDIMGKYFDIGSHAGYVKANIHFGLKEEGVKKDIIDFMKEDIHE